MTISQAQILTAIMDLETVFRSPDGETAFASVTVGGHIETWPIRSKAYRRWLQRKFYESEHKPASAQAMTDALGAIEARAHFAGYRIRSTSALPNMTALSTSTSRMPN